MLLSIKDGSFSAGVPGIGTDFLVAKVELLSTSSLRVWYTHPPVLGANKATDGTSYSLTGPNTVQINLATATTASPKAIDIYLDRDLTYGQWKLSFTQAKIVSSITSALLPETPAYIFNVVAINQDIPGLSNDSNLVRKFFNPAFLGKPNWEGLIEGLNTGNSAVVNTVNKLFDQFYVSSASGKYLSIRASNNGIAKPTALGLVDDAFRTLAITIVNDKLTQNANLDLLEIIYGPQAVRANISSALYEPFTLFDKATLNITVDGHLAVPVVFLWTDFVNPLMATATEVCAAINKAFVQYKSNAFAVEYQDLETNETKVRIFSGTLGLRSSIEVTSGSAQSALQFDALLYNSIDNTLSPSTQVTITDLPLNKASITFSTASTKVLSIFQNVVAGDYINILGSEFSLNNRGSFPIESITTISGVRKVTINNKVAVTETVSPISSNSLSIWRPTTKQIYDSSNYALLSNKLGQSRVSLPVNTEIVVRDRSNGAYLSNPVEYNLSSITRLPTGSSSLSGSTPTLNQFGIISGFLPKLLDATDLISTAASSGTSAASLFSCATAVGGYTGILAKCITDLNNVNIVLGGRNIDTSTDIKSVSKYTVTGQTVTNQVVSHTYTWATTSNSNISGLGSSLALIDYPRFWNKILVVGGYPGGPTHATGSGYAEQRTFLYSATANTLTEITGTQPSTPLADAGLVWLSSPTNKAVTAGGVDNTGVATANINFWDPSYAVGNQLGQWGNTYGISLNYARSNAKLADVGGGNALVIGGRLPNNSNSSTLTNMGTPLSSCELIKYNSGSYTCVQTGGMTYARFAFGHTTLPGNRILVVGGIGNLHSQPIDPTGNQLNYELKSCEIYDPYTGYWSPIPDTQDPHSYCSCHYEPVLNRVYVCGGSQSKRIEYLDLETMTWKTSVTSLPAVSFRTGSTVAFANTDKPIIIRPGGSYLSGTTEHNNAQAAAIQCYTENGRCGGVNGIVKAAGSPGTASFVTDQPGYTKSDTNFQAVFTSLSAIRQSVLGPYIYDKNQPFGLSGNTLSLKTTIPQGKGCPPIQVDGDVTNLPIEGYLVANFGFKNQVGPFKYFVRDNPTSIYTVLIPDPSYNFPVELLSTDNIVLSVVSQVAAYNPDINTQPGAFYVTASNAGLAAAKQYITDISAAGIDLLINVRYPGDRGLGNEELPMSGSYKLSDIIEVFGPDELDTFLSEARNVT
jgi:hypothetical protein